MGINPGRLGAGKTGIPFIDYRTLSELLPTIFNNDSENSAQFINKLIKHIGINEFFFNVYLTNISWFRFTQDGKNFNYYQLDKDLQAVFTEGFKEEMEVINPRVIVPLLYFLWA